ncbi:hypothetical protein [Corynebacterium confusum]|uniref:hypothetical protein n=1 Tax=Corynebacterium confusum TaxID=71254 RepID=UPI0025B34C02|nr:hypothetical protein [Corynebacterium confusum]WJY89610.1 hypothetical protein CCONF_05340 [Corynebacterium confusum]
MTNLPTLSLVTTRRRAGRRVPLLAACACCAAIAAAPGAAAEPTIHPSADNEPCTLSLIKRGEQPATTRGIIHGEQALALYESVDGPATGVFDSTDSSEAPLASGAATFRVAGTGPAPDAFGFSGDAWVLSPTSPGSHLRLAAPDADAGARTTVHVAVDERPTGAARVAAWSSKPRAASAAAVPFFDSAEQTSGEATLDGDEPLPVGFAFSEPGYYQLRFSFTGDDAEPRDLSVGFLVEDAPSGTSAAQGTVDVTASQGCLDPVAIARDLNGINKELQALDKAVGDTEKKALALVGKKAGKDAAASADQATTSPSAPARPGTQAGGHRTPSAPAAGVSQAAPGTTGSGTQGSARPKPAHSASGGTGTTGTGAAVKPAPKKAAKAAAPKPAGGKPDGAKPAETQDPEAQASGPATEQPVPVGLTMDKVSFWSGILAGMGVVAFLVGVYLVFAVYWRQRRQDRADSAVAQPGD